MSHQGCIIHDYREWNSLWWEQRELFFCLPSVTHNGQLHCCDAIYCLSSNNNLRKGVNYIQHQFVQTREILRDVEAFNTRHGDHVHFLSAMLTPWPFTTSFLFAAFRIVHDFPPVTFSDFQPLLCINRSYRVALLQRFSLHAWRSRPLLPRYHETAADLILTVQSHPEAGLFVITVRSPKFLSVANSGFMGSDCRPWALRMLADDIYYHGVGDQCRSTQAHPWVYCWRSLWPVWCVERMSFDGLSMKSGSNKGKYPKASIG